MPDFRSSPNRRSVPLLARPEHSIFSNAFISNVDLKLKTVDHRTPTSPNRTRIIDKDTQSQAQAYAPSPRPELRAKQSRQKLGLGPRAASALDLHAPDSRSSSPKKSRTSSLFSLFSKPKVEKARGYHEHTPAPPPRPRSPPTLSVPERPVTRQGARTPSHDRPSSRLQDRSQTTLSPAASHSRPPPIPGRAPSRASIKSNTTVKSTKVNKSRSDDAGHRLNVPSNWDPPPLFQAYPQAVKHIVLEVTSSDDKNAQNRSEIKKANRFSGFFGKNTRHDTTTLAQRPKERKIFVLVTSGHILQYARDGASDRLPEKVLRLGRHSVAFASDLVPGKPFVLQILQSDSNTATGDIAEKSLLSKFGLGLQSTAPKSVTSILLIFEEPTHMNEWMIAVRREIETLGGRKFSCSTVRAQPDNADTISISSQRYRGLQRTMSMKSNRSGKAPSISSVPSLPTSPIVQQGSDWSSSASAYGRSQRSSEVTNTSEQHSFDTAATSPGADEPDLNALYSKYNPAVAQKSPRATSPEFNMHDFLTPQPSPSAYPVGDLTLPYANPHVLMKGDMTDPQDSSPARRPSSRASERFQRNMQSKTSAHPTSITKGYRGWSATAASKHPPLPPLPASPTSPLTPSIEVTRPLHVRKHSYQVSVASPQARITEPVHDGTSSQIPSPNQEHSSPTLPRAALATPPPSTPTLATPGKRSRPTSSIRNSSSPLPFRSSTYLSSELSLPRSRSPSPLPSPGSPAIPEQNPLRRPASLPVRADPVPFLSSVRLNGLAVSPNSPYRAPSPRDSGTGMPMMKTSQRASIQVPIVRPPTIKQRSGSWNPELKSRRSAPLLNQAHLPPMNGPPPRKALPAVPV